DEHLPGGLGLELAAQRRQHLGADQIQLLVSRVPAPSGVSSKMTVVGGVTSSTDQAHTIRRGGSKSITSAFTQPSAESRSVFIRKRVPATGANSAAYITQAATAARLAS